MTESNRSSTLQALSRQAALCTAAIGLLQPVLPVASVVTDATAVAKTHGGFGYNTANGKAAAGAPRRDHNAARTSVTAAATMNRFVGVGGAIQTYSGLLSTPIPGKISGPIVTLHMGLGLVLAFDAAALYMLGNGES